MILGNTVAEVAAFLIQAADAIDSIVERRMMAL